MKNELINPYANALDGLDIKDPVSDFFNFCKEREKIRKKREKNESFPWSDDIIFQNGRFLNVFREDDRVSRSILNFAGRYKDDLPLLVQALFFARWCNKQEVIDSISNKIFTNKKMLKEKVNSFEQWCNFNAYPVEPINWDDKRHSRLNSAVELFDDIKISLADLISNADGNVIVATDKVNERFKMVNNFPIFMAIIDISWFRPDIIKPTSPVPTGIGAVAFLDRLQEFLGLENHQDTCEKMIKLQKKYWPEAKREFLPIDIEYLSCECRKYFSYVNGTKKFEGKNKFIPFQKESV